MSLNDSSTRPIQIASGRSSVTFTEPSTYTLQLPMAGLRTGRDEVCLRSLTIQKSWPNISQAKGNNQFSYEWPGAGSFPVKMGDGAWTFDDIRAYLRLVMRQNKHYLIDQSGAEQYYLDLVMNPVLYCLSLTATPLPATLPEGWTNPGVDLVAALAQTPQLVIPSSFSRLTGFAAGSYPTDPSTSIYQVNSGIPQISDVSSISVLCNLCDSTGFGFDRRILACFVHPGGKGLVSIEPVIPDWVPVQQNTDFSEITISLVDQAMRPIPIRDSEGMVAILHIRRRRD